MADTKAKLETQITELRQRRESTTDSKVRKRLNSQIKQKKNCQNYNHSIQNKTELQSCQSSIEKLPTLQSVNSKKAINSKTTNTTIIK